MAQLVEWPTLAQVMISWFEGSSSTLGSVLTAQSLGPTLDPVSPSLCPSPTHAYSLSKNIFKYNLLSRVSWVAQSVKHPTLAQVMISWFVSSSPVSGSVLTSQSLESALDSLSQK